jgi:expansin (peptidoglycan-binding protein)
MAKNNKPAQAYDEPHKMSGEKTNTSTYSGYEAGAKVLDKANISVGGISKGNYAKENPYGVGVMRGYGAAIKGRKISGKMG